MKKNELVSSLLCALVGVMFLIGSIDLGLGSLDEPGPGFFPFVMAACLISFSSIHFVFSLIKGRKFNVSTRQRFWPEDDGIKRILLTVVFLIGYVLCLNHLGFVLTTLLFMFVLLRFVEPQGWLRIFLVGVLTAGLSYAIFQAWLKSNLPVGFLGF
jgi:putative tricarboxylic transport membrane protein